MRSFFSEIRQTILPERDSEYGPLPPLLVSMTVVSGLVDAFSYLVLGHVFVANMTGNVVLLGFALAGAPGFSIGASSAAIGCFALGALIGGTFASRLNRNRARLLSTATATQSVFLAAGVTLAAISPSPVAAGYRYGLIVVLAVAMGVQNAAARKLAVPDLTTSVLTLTITGIAADSAIVGKRGTKAGRRVVAVAAMLAGAVVGAAFVIHVDIVYPLVIALALTVMVALTTRVLVTSNPTWARVET